MTNISSTTADLEVNLVSQPLLHYRPDQVAIHPASAADCQELLRRMYEENHDYEGS